MAVENVAGGSKKKIHIDNFFLFFPAFCLKIGSHIRLVEVQDTVIGEKLPLFDGPVPHYLKNVGFFEKQQKV